MTAREHALKAIWRERIHVDPITLATSPRSVQSHFDTAWQLVEAYLRLLSPFPASLLNWWLDQPQGHVVISSAPSRYHPGIQTWHSQSYTSVAHIATPDLLGSGKGAFLASIRLLDHLFGNGAAQDQTYFSAGYGITPELADAAQRYIAIERLRYGHAELNIVSADSYLAETLWLALNDRQALNRIDPLLEKLFYQTILDERFWLRQIALKPGSTLPINRTPELR
ncbi:MAG: hypothetical protein ACYCZF_05015 [Anaerolineae bacterium]